MPTKNVSHDTLIDTFLSLTEASAVLLDQYTHAKNKIQAIRKSVKGKKLTLDEKKGLAMELEAELSGFKNLCELINSRSI